MPSTDPPFPPSGGFLDAIRESSRSLRQASNIKVEPSSITRLLNSPSFTTSFNRVSASHGLAFPLQFSSPLSELNLLSTLSLLNFASGYRVPLHVQTGRGAWDSIRAFTFSLYISSAVGGEGDLLTAKGMQNMEDVKVAELMGVNIHVERRYASIAGLTIGELGGPMHELVCLVKKTLNETGEVLVQAGYPDLGTFVVEALKEGVKARDEKDPWKEVDVVLEQIVRAIPGFRDMSVVNGEPIYCFKKALFLIHAITVRFGSLSSPPFPIPRTSGIPVFTDNVLPSILIHLGVIDLSDSSLSSLFPGAGSDEKLAPLLGLAPPKADKAKAKKIPNEGPVLTEAQAYILRASAIDACELIVEAARGGEGIEKAWVKDLTLPELDMWLWAVAKDREDYRKLERFVLTDTVFF